MLMIYGQVLLSNIVLRILHSYGNVLRIMFFNKSDDKNAFLIPNGTELYKILEDSFGFEFYITNQNHSYLLCFNHHDILYGSGEAKKWVSEIE